MVEPAQLHHRRDQGARDGGALRRLAAQGDRPDRRVLRCRRHRSAGRPAARRRGREAPDHPGLLLAGRPAERRARADPAQHPGPAAVRGRAVRGHQRAGQAARRRLRHRPAERACSWSTARSPAGSSRRARTTRARSSTRTSSSARAARCTACPRKAPVRRARWSPRSRWPSSRRPRSTRTTCPAAGMPSPLVGVLDEAANVCRWKDLPDLYSHFGSRGIVLMTILQSWAQGVECWGERGMEKLWSAANIRVYGGGVVRRELPRAAEQADRRLRHRLQFGVVQQGQARHQPADPAAQHPRGLRPRRDAARPRGRVPVRYPGDDGEDGAVVHPAGRRCGEGVAAPSTTRERPVRSRRRPAGTRGSRPARSRRPLPRGPEKPVWEQNEEQRGGW